MNRSPFFVLVALGAVAAASARPTLADIPASPLPLGSPAAGSSSAPALSSAPAVSRAPSVTPAPSVSDAPAASIAFSGPVVGRQAPGFTLRTLDGKTVTLDSFKGKTLVINAWATWCPPCREEMPALISSAPRLAKGNVAVLGVDTTEAVPVVRAYAVARDVTYPLAVTTDDAFANAYDVQYFPTTFVIDPQGVLRARYVDVISPTQLAGFVEAARAGRNVEITSPLQQKIDATLADTRIAFGTDPAAVEANAKKAEQAIAAAEEILDASDPGADKAVDFVRTRAEEAVLRDRAIAALVNVGTSVADKTLLTRLRADAAIDREDWHEAGDDYRAVLAIAPNDRDALAGLALSSSRLGDESGASDADAKLVALDPGDVGALVDLALAEAKADRKEDANATFAAAIAAAEKKLAAAPHEPRNLRMLAYAHLYAGRAAAEDGDAREARVQFDETSRLAAKLPKNDARHDMYLEEAQEAIVALGLAGHGGFSVSLAPWTGPDLPGSIPNTIKFRLAVAGNAGRNISLVASDVPKNWVASFCSDSTCAPFRTTIGLPPSGVKVVEFQLVPPGSASAAPKVRVLGNDGKTEASATT